jgi:hypothetical protein
MYVRMCALIDMHSVRKCYAELCSVVFLGPRANTALVPKFHVALLASSTPS